MNTTTPTPAPGSCIESLRAGPRQRPVGYAEKAEGKKGGGDSGREPSGPVIASFRSDEDGGEPGETSCIIRAE